MLDTTNQNTAPATGPQAPQGAAADPVQSNVPQAPAAAPARPKKVRRVGTFTFGLVLIAAGVLMLASLFVPAADLLNVVRFAPLVLVFLGIEVLVYAARPNVVLRYDFLSMLACAFILVVIGGSTILPRLWDWYGPGYDVRVDRLDRQLEARGVAALEAVPALRDIVDAADFSLYDYSMLHYTDTADLNSALAEGECSINAWFSMSKDYESAEDFAADCARVMAAFRDMPLARANFESPYYNYEHEPYPFFELTLSGAWQTGMTQEQMTARTASSWRWQDMSFPNRAELERYQTEAEAGQAGEEYPEELYQQSYEEGLEAGYDQGYAAGYDTGYNAGAEGEPYDRPGAIGQPYSENGTPAPEAAVDNEDTARPGPEAVPDPANTQA